MTETPSSDRRTFGGIFLLCLTTLLYALVLTRLSPILMGYIASTAIALALFAVLQKDPAGQRCSATTSSTSSMAEF